MLDVYKRQVLERKGKMTELLKIQDFDQMYAIMEASFPDDEYRGYEGQRPVSYTHLDVYKRQIWQSQVKLRFTMRC